MPTFYCNYLFLLGTRGPLTLGGPLDFAYPAYPIVTPLHDVGGRSRTRPFIRPLRQRSFSMSHQTRHRETASAALRTGTKIPKTKVRCCDTSAYRLSGSGKYGIKRNLYRGHCRGAFSIAVCTFSTQRHCHRTHRYLILLSTLARCREATTRP